MGKAAGFIRLMLAGVFLLALALSVLPASANACRSARPVPGTAQLPAHVASPETVAAIAPIAAALDARHHGHHGGSTPTAATSACAAALRPRSCPLQASSHRHQDPRRV